LVNLSPLPKAGNKRASILDIVAVILLLVAAFVFLMLLAVNTFARLVVVSHWIAHLKGIEHHKAASAPARTFHFLFRTNITLSTCTAILVVVQEFRHSTTSAVVSSIGHAESPATKVLSYPGLLFLRVIATLSSNLTATWSLSYIDLVWSRTLRSKHDTQNFTFSIYTCRERILCAPTLHYYTTFTLLVSTWPLVFTPGTSDTRDVGYSLLRFAIYIVTCLLGSNYVCAVSF